MQWNLIGFHAAKRVMDARPFQDVAIMTSHPGRMRVNSSALSAAEYILSDWPLDEGEKLSIAKHALLAAQ